MNGKARPLGLLALTAALVVSAFAASPAQAEFGIEKFEALTCKTDVSAPGVGDWSVNGDPCLASDPIERFYTQAAGHPNYGITAFLMNQVAGPPAFPDGFIKEIRTELPQGLGVNPEATPQCTRKQLSEFAAPPPPVITKCATEVPGSQVGVNYLTTISSGPPAFPVPAGTEFTVPIPVYNLEPEFGEPASAGFNATGKPTILESDLNPKDQHISFTIRNIPSMLEGGAPIIGSRLVFNGKAGAGYLTMPSSCAGPQVTILTVKSHPYPAPPGPEVQDTATFETAIGADGCDKVPFEPGIGVAASGATDSPEPTTVDVTLPYNPDPESIANSHLLKAKVILPEGAGLNPSIANGLVPCTDAQFAKDTNQPIACPDASKIGTVEVKSQTLPEAIGGTVYVGEPKSNQPSSGEQFRIFIHVSSAKFGVNVRLIGNVFPNLQTGQLTAVVDNNPEAPFESFKVKLNGGARGALTTPNTCGPHTTVGRFTPWSRPNEEVTATSQFTLTTLPGGAPCPKTLAERPFSPTYAAGPTKTKAGAFTPFELHMTRSDGEQELRQVDVKLPPGMVAQLRNLDYCPEESIDEAEREPGSKVIQTPPPPCPDKSFLGTSRIAAGSGPDPYVAAGSVYLAGPYKGAPLSLVFVTPAVAGPFDLGTVVVRVRLEIDPETVQVTAISDPIPYVFGGVKLDLRSVDISIYRKPFTLNPTNCKRSKIVADIAGGGANPADPAAWSSTRKASAFRATKCGALKFLPRLEGRIFGGPQQARRAANPKFRVILWGHYGDANVKRAAFIMPASTILDQSHIQTICTRVQLDAGNCPKGSVYGYARARSPLLSDVVKGPVYLTSSKHELPDLLADLHGQIHVRLRGVISSVDGRLKTVFPRVPDVPVRKFVLAMKGGSRGLLLNSENLCGRPQFAKANLKAQNGKQKRMDRLRLRIDPCR